ncbi:MAG: redoxin domain-containing protein [Candidatus Tantalella remota]|nr:redoxin domain-containing protein [Candidatus Tantalella remota]
MKSRCVVIAMTMALLLGSFGLVSCDGQGSASANADMAPDFTLKDLDGNNYSFASTKGKVVILDFWATWCPPCRIGIPEFQALYEQYKDKGLVVVGVALDQGGVQVVKPFVKKNGVTYLVAIGDRGVVAAYGGIRGIPTTFVIDRQGKIVQKYVGYREKKIFEADIKKLL